MSQWQNNTLGKGGRFYPLLYLIPIPLLGVGIYLLNYSLADGFQFWEQILGSGFGLFGMFYFIKSIEAIVITRSTIKTITFDGHMFGGQTFSGKKLTLERWPEVLKNSSFFAKKNIHFLFGKSSNNMIIRSASGCYYLSGSMDGIDDLHHLLSPATPHT